MAILERFRTPAGLAEPTEEDAAEWSNEVKDTLAPYVATFPQFYDPTAVDTPADAQVAQIVWSAFPATLRNQTTSEEKRWQLADESRLRQDEYCEWSVERSNGNITRVTFTSEVREYWHHVFQRDPNRLLALYREYVSPEVELDDLLFHGNYAPGNPWNETTSGRLAHLMQGNNNLLAAVDLSANATVLRERNGARVTGHQELVDCAGLGNPFRNSDPQIAAAVNNAAATGAEIALQDPIGLYIHGLLTPGMATPDGADPASFWTIERGDAEHILRARYEVPPERDYTVSHITIDGRPIRFGAQLADRVQVRITAVVKPGTHKPEPLPCET